MLLVPCVPIFNKKSHRTKAEECFKHQDHLLIVSALSEPCYDFLTEGIGNPNINEERLKNFQRIYTYVMHHHTAKKLKKYYIREVFQEIYMFFFGETPQFALQGVLAALIIFTKQIHNFSSNIHKDIFVFVFVFVVDVLLLKLNLVMKLFQNND